MNSIDITYKLNQLYTSINQAEVMLKQQINIQKEDINTLNRNVDFLSLSAVIISIISAIIVIVILIIGTIKPLSALIKKIRDMNDKEVYQGINDTHSSNEMRDLIFAFNHMIEKVNTQQAKLQDQNDELMAQGEELAAQNEELTSQGEELTAQNEEIIAQQQEMQEALSNLAMQEEQLQKLYQFSKLLNETIDQEELVKHVLEGLLNEMNAQAGAFILYSQETKLLEIKYTSGLLGTENMFSLKVGEGLAGRAAQLRQPILANYNEGQLRTQGLYGQLNMTYEIYQPLVSRDRLLGVIALGRLGERQFTNSEQLLLTSLADQISMALTNTSTHRHTQEALLKIQELDKLKSEMINTVSHELRTPLASILGFAELLLKKSPNEEKAKKYINTIYSEAERLKLLINDFLDLQKIETGRFDLDMKQVSLTELLQKCIGVYDGQQTGNHDISLNIEDNLPMVTTDPDRITQVVGNLLSNAIKYSPNGGQIVVSAVRSGNNQVIVSIKDHGLGIPEEALKHLFTPFYRVDNSDRREIGGTGLGLAICHKLVHALGGDIWADSIHGQGSTFNFTLPLKDDAVKQKISNASDIEAVSKDLILIVEDDPSMSNLISEALKEEGYQSLIFDNGLSTLSYLENNSVGAIILDLILVGPLDGWELLRRLKSNERTKEIPVIVSSCVDQKEEGKKYDIAEYLVKPFAPEQLINVLHKVTKSTTF